MKKKEDLEQKLAEERTLLSNKRTFFSSIRTSFALFLAGIAFLGFSKIKWVIYAGIVSIIIGFIFIIISAINYSIMRKKIIEEYNKNLK